MLRIFLKASQNVSYGFEFRNLKRKLMKERRDFLSKKQSKTKFYEINGELFKIQFNLEEKKRKNFKIRQALNKFW